MQWLQSIYTNDTLMITWHCCVKAQLHLWMKPMLFSETKNTTHKTLNTLWSLC